MFYDPNKVIYYDINTFNNKIPYPQSLRWLPTEFVPMCFKQCRYFVSINVSYTATNDLIACFTLTYQNYPHFKLLGQPTLYNNIDKHAVVTCEGRNPVLHIKNITLPHQYQVCNSPIYDHNKITCNECKHIFNDINCDQYDIEKGVCEINQNNLTTFKTDCEHTTCICKVDPVYLLWWSESKNQTYILQDEFNNIEIGHKNRIGNIKHPVLFTPLTIGCTDSTAENYNIHAIYDDKSCIIRGCTNETSLNYNPNAIVNEGCIFYSPSPPPCIDYSNWTCQGLSYVLPNENITRNFGCNTIDLIHNFFAATPQLEQYIKPFSVTRQICDNLYHTYIAPNGQIELYSYNNTLLYSIMTHPVLSATFQFAPMNMAMQCYTDLFVQCPCTCKSTVTQHFITLNPGWNSITPHIKYPHSIPTFGFKNADIVQYKDSNNGGLSAYYHETLKRWIPEEAAYFIPSRGYEIYVSNPLYLYYEAEEPDNIYTYTIPPGVNTFGLIGKNIYVDLYYFTFSNGDSITYYTQNSTINTHLYINNTWNINITLTPDKSYQTILNYPVRIVANDTIQTP